MFVLGCYLFLVAHSFPRATCTLLENCLLLGTDNVCGQISQRTFAPNGGYCLYQFRLCFEQCFSLLDTPFILFHFTHLITVKPLLTCIYTPSKRGPLYIHYHSLWHHEMHKPFCIIIILLFIQNISSFLKEFLLTKYNTTLSPGFLGQRFNNLQRASLLTSFWRHWFNNFRRAALLMLLIQYGEDSFQIWCTAAGYGELCMWF